MKRFNVSGFTTCSAFQQAKAAITGLSTIFPSKISINLIEYATRDEYMSWLAGFRESISAPEHKTSPIVWLEGGKYLGGRDDTLAWCRSYLSTSGSSYNELDVTANIDPFNHAHGFDYDIVVIGGGSGGLACSKEAQKLGAKVAVLDFVRPSPAGSKWGIGGTCVNVGCIPKKLMHTASILGELAHHATAYGWVGGNKAVHNWETMRENVQNHIKGLNFGYRVQLREAGVTYLNKLGRFVNQNTLECTDAKGAVQTITAARFVVAVGGRPTPLSCPGAELAISSDDLFSLEKSPGKTCVVGAGYVALECAGFLTGLKQGDVTILVRSILLRGFDRDLVERVKTCMLANGTNIIEGSLPASIEKLPSGRLLVKFTNGGQDEFDTVLVAVGRNADTKNLGLDALGIVVNSGNGKIPCKNEQTCVPNIYAIGDVIENAPELTPVAVLAGKLLAKRLFGASTQPMVYTDIATTVFTPLELGTVGLSEEDAIEKYGESAIECYVSQFAPLEWSVVESEGDVSCFAKIVVNTHDNNKVIGMHIAAPNAGEIFQGFAVAFKKGITYQDLIDTVGIHPTIAEEFTTMTITKSSGTNIAKAGC